MATFGYIQNADIPFEQRMKYIIEDYVRIFDIMDKAKEHFHRVEERSREWQEKYSVMRTRQIGLENKCKNLKNQVSIMSEKNGKLKAEIARLKQILDKNHIDY